MATDKSLAQEPAQTDTVRKVRYTKKKWRELLHVGQRFGRLTLVKQTRPGPYGHLRWNCKCDCGREAVVLQSCLRRERSTSSCGCLISEAITKHGMYGTPEYKAWAAIVQRCRNSKDKRYKNYGGRGIGVCDHWLRFQNFFQDVGLRPTPKHSIERKDNNAGYEPGNVTWDTKTVQSRNTRSNRCLTYRGETRTLSEWAEITGLSAQTIGTRLRLGFPVDLALTAPSDKGASRRLMRALRQEASQ